MSVEGAAPDVEAGHEQETMLAALGLTPRLRRLLSDLDALVMAEGFMHLGTDALCQRLHCSKASLYRLADSREGLFELVINLWLARARDIGWQEYADASASWQDRLVKFLGAARIATRDASLQFMRDVWQLPVGYRAVKAHQEQRVGDIEWIIQEGVAAGDFEDVHPKLAADVIFHAMRLAVEPEFLTRVGLPLHEAFTEAYRIFEHGLIRRPGDLAREVPTSAPAPTRRRRSSDSRRDSQMISTTPLIPG